MKKKEAQKKLKEIMLILQTQHCDIAYAMTVLLEEPLRTQVLEHMLYIAVKEWANLNISSEAAKLLNRELTHDELRQMFEKQFNEWRNIGTDTLDIANTMREPDRTHNLEKVLKALVKGGNSEGATTVARDFLDRDLTQEELRQLLGYYQTHSSSEDVEKLSNQIGCTVEPDDYEQLLAANVESGYLAKCREIAQKLDRDLKVSELEIIFNVNLKKGHYAYARKTALMMPYTHQDKCLSQVIEKCLDEYEADAPGSMKEAYTTAKNLKSPTRRQKYVKKMLQLNIQDGNMLYIRQMVPCLGHTLTLKELKTILEINIQYQKVDYAREVATQILEHYKAQNQ